MSRKEEVFIAIGAILLLLIGGAVGGVIYALLRASITALRWWAGLATLAVPVCAALAWYLGMREARARIAGIDEGIERVTRAATATVGIAERASQVRVATAQQLRRPTSPTFQQVFLPGGLPTGGPLILPVKPGEDEVEL